MTSVDTDIPLALHDYTEIVALHQKAETLRQARTAKGDHQGATNFIERRAHLQQQLLQGWRQRKDDSQKLQERLDEVRLLLDPEAAKRAEEEARLAAASSLLPYEEVLKVTQDLSAVKQHSEQVSEVTARLQHYLSLYEVATGDFISGPTKSGGRDDFNFEDNLKNVKGSVDGLLGHLHDNGLALSPLKDWFDRQQMLASVEENDYINLETAANLEDAETEAVTKRIRNELDRLDGDKQKLNSKWEEFQLQIDDLKVQQEKLREKQRHLLTTQQAAEAEAAKKAEKAKETGSGEEGVAEEDEEPEPEKSDEPGSVKPPTNDDAFKSERRIAQLRWKLTQKNIALTSANGQIASMRMQWDAMATEFRKKVATLQEQVEDGFFRENQLRLILTEAGVKMPDTLKNNIMSEKMRSLLTEVHDAIVEPLQETEIEKADVELQVTDGDIDGITPEEVALRGVIANAIGSDSFLLDCVARENGREQVTAVLQSLVEYWGNSGEVPRVPPMKEHLATQTDDVVIADDLNASKTGDEEGDGPGSGEAAPPVITGDAATDTVDLFFLPKLTLWEPSDTPVELVTPLDASGSHFRNSAAALTNASKSRGTYPAQTAAELSLAETPQAMTSSSASVVAAVPSPTGALVDPISGELVYSQVSGDGEIIQHETVASSGHGHETGSGNDTNRASLDPQDPTAPATGETRNVTGTGPGTGTSQASPGLHGHVSGSQPSTQSGAHASQTATAGGVGDATSTANATGGVQGSTPAAGSAEYGHSSAADPEGGPTAAGHNTEAGEAGGAGDDDDSYAGPRSPGDPQTKRHASAIARYQQAEGTPGDGVVSDPNHATTTGTHGRSAARSDDVGPSGAISDTGRAISAHQYSSAPRERTVNDPDAVDDLLNRRGDSDIDGDLALDLAGQRAAGGGGRSDRSSLKRLSGGSSRPEGLGKDEGLTGHGSQANLRTGHGPAGTGTPPRHPNPPPHGQTPPHHGGRQHHRALSLTEPGNPKLSEAEAGDAIGHPHHHHHPHTHRPTHPSSAGERNPRHHSHPSEDGQFIAGGEQSHPHHHHHHESHDMGLGPIPVYASSQDMGSTGGEPLIEAHGYQSSGNISHKSGQSSGNEESADYDIRVKKAKPAASEPGGHKDEVVVGGFRGVIRGPARFSKSRPNTPPGELHFGGQGLLNSPSKSGLRAPSATSAVSGHGHTLSAGLDLAFSAHHIGPDTKRSNLDRYTLDIHGRPRRTTRPGSARDRGSNQVSQEAAAEASMGVVEARIEYERQRAAEGVETQAPKVLDLLFGLIQSEIQSADQASSPWAAHNAFGRKGRRTGRANVIPKRGTVMPSLAPIARKVKVADRQRQERLTRLQTRLVAAQEQAGDAPTATTSSDIFKILAGRNRNRKKKETIRDFVGSDVGKAMMHWLAKARAKLLRSGRAQSLHRNSSGKGDLAKEGPSLLHVRTVKKRGVRGPGGRRMSMVPVVSSKRSPYKPRPPPVTVKAPAHPGPSRAQVDGHPKRSSATGSRTSSANSENAQGSQGGAMGRKVVSDSELTDEDRPVRPGAKAGHLSDHDGDDLNDDLPPTPRQLRIEQQQLNKSLEKKMSIEQFDQLNISR